MLCIGVNKIKINFDTSQLCCGGVHFLEILKEILAGLALSWKESMKL